MLNTVVLPAPFGPIKAKISPSSTLSCNSFTATTPPNRIVTVLSSSNGWVAVVGGASVMPCSSL
jgi:hypothetical protein